jgi:hypothetical protein
LTGAKKAFECSNLSTVLELKNLYRGWTGRPLNDTNLVHESTFLEVEPKLYEYCMKQSDKMKDTDGAVCMTCWNAYDNNINITVLTLGGKDLKLTFPKKGSLDVLKARVAESGTLPASCQRLMLNGTKRL